MSRAPTLALLVGSVLLSGCVADLRRFALADPLWEDTDRQHVPKEPAQYYSGLLADGADQMFFRPIADFWAFHRPGESVNVNALDEVVNSAWFQNRIGLFRLSPEEVARAACGNTPTLSMDTGPWVVTAAKPNGANPGFFIKAGDGHSYLLKFDGPLQPGRATSADVIGSKLYWAAGYHTPCNEIVHFDPKHITIAEGATAEDAFGEDQPIRREDVDRVLAMALRRKDGLLRASASRFVPGRPIGPFRYEGLRSDDPNDAIPHEDRRELRAARVFGAWINHFDSREQNTMDVWVKDGEREYIRHYYLDWGDSLGGRWPLDGISRRLGHSYYLDWGHVLGDLLTLGFWPRPWNEVTLNQFEIFGYFDAENFEPRAWKGGYPNPAFERLTDRDALWAARILSNIDEARIRAVVKTAEFTDPRHEAFMVEVLLARRQKILEAYLRSENSLSNFRVVRRGHTADPRAQSVCFEDLALLHGVTSLDTVFYKMRFRAGARLDQELGWLQFTPDPEHPHRSCILLPLGYRRPSELAKPGAPDDDPLRYGVLDIFVHQEAKVTPTSHVELHFYDLGPDRGFRLVGIDRPPHTVLPDLY